jgi:hypothetical protein
VTVLDIVAVCCCHLSAVVGDVVSVYGMEVTFKVCSAYNEVQRIKEELRLLPREMQAHLQHWESVLDQQAKLIDLLLPAAADAGTSAATAASTTDLAQRLQAGGMQVGISMCPSYYFHPALCCQYIAILSSLVVHFKVCAWYRLKTMGLYQTTACVDCAVYCGCAHRQGSLVATCQTAVS